MLRGRFVSKTPEDPKVVETIGEFLQRGVQFFDTGKSCKTEQLLFEGSNEWFDASVQFNAKQLEMRATLLRTGQPPTNRKQSNFIHYE